MLPKRFRIRREKDIKHVRRARPVSRKTLMSVRAHNREDNDSPRFAIAVGRRVSPKAVARNRVTRVIRAAVAELIPSLREGVDVFISAHAPADRYSLPVCREELTRHFHNIHIWKKRQ